jgi:hypothetical protein
MKAPGGRGGISPYSFSSSALDGVSGQHHTPAALYPRYPLYRRAPEPVWTQRIEEKSYAFVVDRTPIVQSIDRHYTD